MRTILVNATGKPIHVLPDGKKKPVALPEWPAPSLIELSHADTDSIDILFDTAEGKKRTATLNVDSSDQDACLAACLPPALDGVAYLVEPEVMFRFPWRTDFVTPSTYGWVQRKRKGKGKGGERWRWILTSVRRGPLAVATVDTSNLEDLFDEAEMSGNGTPSNDK